MKPLIRLILSRIVDAATVLGAVALVLMMVHITADVVAKFVFSSPLPGTIAVVSNYYMVAVIFIPLAFAERKAGHISVEVLTDHLPRRLRSRLGIVSALYTAGIFGLLTWRGVEEALRKSEVGSFIIEQDVRIDTWPAYFLLPLGTGLILAVVVFKILRRLGGGPGCDMDKTF